MGNLDYNKTTFTKDDIELLSQESMLLKEKYPDRIPILIQLDSDVLKITKHKFLVGADINLVYFIDILKSKLINGGNDHIIIKITKINSDGTRTLEKLPKQSIILKDFYEQYNDKLTGMLIFTVSRQTTAKWIKSYIYGN